MTENPTKFVEFYFAELLNHVRRMSEQRFTPVDYHKIKRLVAFLLADTDVMGNIRRLDGHLTLNPVYNVLSEILDRIARPDFRKGEMLATIEMESEKLSQALGQITRQDPSLLSKDFAGLGIQLDMPSKESAVEATPTVKTASQPFSRVDDMVGFFKRRGQIVEPASDSSDSNADGYSRPMIALKEDSANFADALAHLESRMSQLKTNFSRTRYVVEVGVAFDRLAQRAASAGHHSLSDRCPRVKKSLDRIADLVDDGKTTFSSQAFDLLSVVVERTKDLVIGSPIAARNLDEALQLLVHHFEPSAPDTLVQIHLDFSQVAPDDLSVYREDASYQLDRMADGLRRLESGQNLKDALQDIYQCLRSLTTSSRLLRLENFIGHLASASSLVRKAESGTLQVPDVWTSDLNVLLEMSKQLVSGGGVPEVEWKQLRERMESPGTLDMKQESTAGDSSRAETVSTAPQLQEKDEVASGTTEAAGEKAAAEYGGHDWADALQSTVDQHPYALTPEYVKKEDVAEAIVPEVVNKEEQPQSVESASIADIIQETDDVVRRPSKESHPHEDGRTAKVEGDLLNIMATGDTDLTDYKIRQFTEKLEVEPENIVSVSTPKKKRKGKNKTATSVDQEVIQTATEKPGGFILEETNFASIDEEILDIFGQESDGYFKILDKAIGRLAGNIKDETSLKEIERASHSLKSSSRMLGLARISSMAAAIELIAERCNEKELEFTDDLRVLIADAMEAARQLVDRKPVEATGLVVHLAQLERQLSAPNIFIGSIPGASTFVESSPNLIKVSRPPEARQESKKREVVVEPSEAPKDQVEESASTSTVPAPVVPVVEADTSGAGYFEKIGVDQEIVEIFKEEAGSYLKLMVAALTTLSGDLSHRGAVRDIEKSAHSLRSSTKMLGFQKISNTVRPIESIAERVNKHTLALNNHILEVFRQASEAIRMLVDGTDVKTEPLIEELNAIEASETVVVKEEPKTKTTTSPPKRPVRKKSKTKKTPPQDAFFADIQFNADPILRQLDKGASSLLEEMAASSG